MGFLVIGIVCILGSVGGLEIGGSLLQFVLTFGLGVVSLIKGIAKFQD